MRPQYSLVKSLVSFGSAGLFVINKTPLQPTLLISNLFDHKSLITGLSNASERWLVDDK
jgi:hypothetical protein